MKIFMLVGMPGCGKTHYGNELLKKYPNAIFFDDIGRKDTKSKNDLLHAINNKEPIIIVSDPHLCFVNVRKKSIIFLDQHAKDYEIKWIFFENDAEKCLKNVKYRNDGRKVEHMIQMLEKNYVIPEGVEPIIIWQKGD